MTKVETYSLDGNNASSIPLPHDCEIKDIREDDDYLIIDFEDDISYHDAIRVVHPDAQTLTVRFHLEYHLYNDNCVENSIDIINATWPSFGNDVENYRMSLGTRYPTTLIPMGHAIPNWMHAMIEGFINSTR